MNTVDARNMPCPEPVMLTKKALDGNSQAGLTVLVNTTEACENVQRFAESQGCTVTVSEKDGVSTIEITKGQPTPKVETKKAPVLVVGSDQLGTGDEALGQLLINKFIDILVETEPRPSKMIFLNRGVMLTTEGSAVLDTLHELEAQGVEILSCGTCLNYYKVKDKLKAGKVTNMYDTVSSLMNADRVVRV